jgi:hypothetical protein
MKIVNTTSSMSARSMPAGSSSKQQLQGQNVLSTQALSGLQLEVITAAAAAAIAISAAQALART